MSKGNKGKKRRKRQKRHAERHGLTVEQARNQPRPRRGLDPFAEHERFRREVEQ